MNYHINFDEFDDYKKYFKDKLDAISDETYSIYKKANDVQWVGLGHDKTINALNDQIIELSTIIENLEKFLNYFNSVTEEYNEGVQETKKSFKEIDDLLNNRRRMR